MLCQSTFPLWTLALSAFAMACLVPEEDIDDTSLAATVPAKGAATTLDIGSWNIEWFGDTANGPSNENQQLSNARDVIAGADLDIWGVAEIVSLTQFNSLESQLTGYQGVLANESIVTSGSTYYSSSEQKVGVLYKSSVATLRSARIILTSYDYDFAGRPPLEVTFDVSLNGTTSSLVVIVLHAKAMSDSTSWQRRRNASIALKSYLDSTYPTQKVVVVGDFNDDVDTSITTGSVSPYQNFVDDSLDYLFPTRALSLAGYSSTTGYPDMIDHHLITNEVQASYMANSADVYYVDQYIANYDTTTSDHYPVLSRYNWGSGGGGGGGGTGKVIVNEILANEPGSSTAGEFIELVNVGDSAVDISGWTLSDGAGVKHMFAGGTSLPAGGVITVFGASSGIPGGTSYAIAASSGSLGLGNSGDTVTLKNGSGTVQDSYTYSSSLAGTDGVSMNRSPDGTANAGFVLHTSLSSKTSSPSKRASGTSW